MKHLSILGSTGSIGRNVLKIVEQFPDKFKVTAVAAKYNIDLVAEQIRVFHPDVAVVYDEEHACELRKKVPQASGVEIFYGIEGYIRAATLQRIDMVVMAIVGSAGLIPTIRAIEAGKDVALANKETLVMAGEIVMNAAIRHGVHILPIDSEHSAVFQCLAGHPRQDLEKIILTASGGPFLTTPIHELADIEPEDALAHPTWQMGRKISIDSATMMNKGFEIIEAKHLFGVDLTQIDVVIHPQSVVHSMVSFCDGTIIAQMGIPDMKAAIAYAMSHPNRLPLRQPLPDFTKIGALTFEKPDMEKFPCLFLAYEACRCGGTLPAVLNAVNEIAVEQFLNKKIGFLTIPDIVRNVMMAHETVYHPSLDAILEADRWAREKAREFITRRL